MSNTWDIFLKPISINYAHQWVGTIESDSQEQAIKQATPLYGRSGCSLVAQHAPIQKSKDFDPTQALARYRELEGLLNLELINNPKWQKMRAQGDTSFLLTSRYFQAQVQLMREIEENGYTIIDTDDDNEHPIYEIEPLEVRV